MATEEEVTGNAEVAEATGCSAHRNGLQSLLDTVGEVAEAMGEAATGAVPDESLHRAEDPDRRWEDRDQR
jgi:hypothetical protein